MNSVLHGEGRNHGRNHGAGICPAWLSGRRAELLKETIGLCKRETSEKEKGRTRFCRILREFAACGLVFAEIIMYNKRQRSHFGRWPE